MLTSINYVQSETPDLLPYVLAHTRIDNLSPGIETTYVNSLTIIATEMVENYLNRVCFTKTLTWTVASGIDPHKLSGAHDTYMLPWQWTTFIAHPVITLPRPANTVTSVVMGLWGESPVTLVADPGDGTGDYQIDCTAALGRIRWISTTFINNMKDYIQITFTSGYGSSANDVPVGIRHAICLIVMNLYEHRGEKNSNPWSNAVEALLAPYRFTYF